MTNIQYENERKNSVIFEANLGLCKSPLLLILSEDCGNNERGVKSNKSIVRDSDTDAEYC